MKKIFCLLALCLSACQLKFAKPIPYAQTLCGDVSADFFPQGAWIIKIVDPDGQVLSAQNTASLQAGWRTSLEPPAEARTLSVSPKGCIAVPPPTADTALIIDMSLPGSSSAQDLSLQKRYDAGSWQEALRGSGFVEVSLQHPVALSFQINCPLGEIYSAGSVASLFEIFNPAAPAAVRIGFDVFSTPDEVLRYTFLPDPRRGHPTLLTEDLNLAGLGTGTYIFRLHVEDDLGRRILYTNASGPADQALNPAPPQCRLHIRTTKPAMPLPIGLGRAVKPMSLIDVQRDPDTTLLVCLKPLEADKECAPEDYEMRSEILPRTEGPHRLCMKVRDKADNESLPYCQDLHVDGESPKLDLQWDLPALNVYAAAWRKPLGNFSASISRLSDDYSASVLLQDRLQCRVEWSSPLGAVRKSEQVECLSGRCQGQVLSEFRDCDAQLEISVREEHLTVAYQSLVLIAKATDEAGNETESRASFLIADYYAPFVEGRAIRALVQDKKVPERIWVGTDSGVFRIEAGSVILYDQIAGLPANRVDALVAVDNEEGGVWAGTSAGLAYFDGRSWTPYARPLQDGSLATGGFPGKRVYATVLDREGRLIAGASNGIFRKVGETWERIGNFSVMTLLMDAEGTLWAGTDDQGVARLESFGSWTFYNQANGLLGHDFVWTLLQDQQGKIWAGSNDGLFTWEGGVWKDFDPGRSILPSNSVYALFEDSQQRLWIGTESGYARRDAAGWEVFDQRRAGLPNNNVRAFLEDRKKRLWIGTEGGGARLGGNDFIVYNKKNSGLPGDLVEALAEDAEGRIWAGTDTAAARIDPMRWTVFREGNGGLPQAYVRSFFLDENKKLWLGSDYGRIAQFDKQGWILSREDFEPEINRGIYAISRTNEGQIVAGGRGGFAVFDGQTWSPFRSNFVADSASASFLHAFLRTSRGELLAATDNNGVVIFEQAGWKKLPGSEQLNSLFVWSIAEDPSGTVWAATDGGLAKRKGNGWEMYTSTNSGLPINNVRAVLADRQGRIWAGTTGGGLTRFDGTGWTVLNQDNSGLPGESVDSLLEDQLGRIWVGTKAGLARWDPE